MQNYYNEVESYVKRCEVNKLSRRYEEENDKVVTYWNIGRLIVEAQGGEKRAKYGNELIKEWSIRLTAKYGYGYNYTNLTRFRKFYLLFLILAAVRQVSWTNIKLIMSINNSNERNYYINESIKKSLSSRDLEKEIKTKSYERLISKPEQLEISFPKRKLELKDNLKNPIIIELNAGEVIKNEYDLEMRLLAKLKSFFNQLGEGFMLAGNQYKVTENSKSYYIDILLFNVNYNCYIVVEIKVRELKKEDKAQIEFYMNLVDRNIKKEFHNKTFGIIISKKQDKFVAEFVGNNSVYPLLYELVKEGEKVNE